MTDFISILERIRPGYKVGGLVEKGTELYAKYPPGVRYRPERNKAKPYEVIKDGKSVGKFKTEKQAAEAYKKLKISKGKIGLSVEEFKTLRLKNKNLTDSEFIRKVIKDKYVTEYGGKFDRVAVGLYNESAGISKQVTKSAVPRKVGEIKEVLNRTKQGKESVKLYNQGKLSLEDLRYKATQAAARKKKADAGFYRTEEYLAKKREYERTPKARETRRLRNKAARQAIENKYGIWTSGNNPKDRFWKSLYTSTQGKGSSRLQLVKETVPKKFKGANVKDVKFYDTKTGKTFGYNNLQKYINKNVGKGAYEKVLTPFKEKFLLNETFFDYKGKNVNLNQLLNKTLIPNYNAGNPYHTSMQVHHPFGIKRNPFVTQLLAYDKNFKEFRPREAVIPDIKKANTFGEKRKVFETFVKKSDPKVLTAPGKKIYGKDVDTITKVKDLYKSQGKKIPPQVLKVLGNIAKATGKVIKPLGVATGIAAVNTAVKAGERNPFDLAGAYITGEAQIATDARRMRQEPEFRRQQLAGLPQIQPEGFEMMEEEDFTSYFNGGIVAVKGVI
jgi:hypothetical protein